MKGWILAIWVLGLVSVVRGQEANIVHDPNAVIREVEDFHAIDVSGAIELVITQGGEHQVAISASETEDLDKIVAETRNGVLYIHYKDGKNWWQNQWNTMGRKFKAYVSAPDIEAVNTSGSGGVRIVGLLKVDELSITVAGSGNISGQIEAESLEIEQSGSSNIRLSGRIGKAEVHCSGSGNVQSSELAIDYCDISIAGSGNAELWVNKELSAKVSGSGNIRYRGDGLISNMSVSGSGKIRKI